MRQIVKVFIFLMLLFFVTYNLSYAESSDQKKESKSLAKSLGNTYGSHYGSKSGIKQNIVNPMMSNTQMTTLDGKTSFNAQIECPNSKSFLQILFQPKSSNDFTALISQDPNLTGHFTYQVATPLISGVCNNGFISCNSGTWDNCRFYQWALSDSKITWVEVADDSPLGTCFCVNDSCGGNVFQQFRQIANTFGAGLAGFIATQQHFAISDVQASFPTVSYYGQDAQKCSITTGDYSGTAYNNPAQYYKNAPSMDNGVSQAVTSQTNNTNSPYYSVMNSEYLKKNPVTEKSCEIKRRVDFPPATDCPNDVINVSFGHREDNSLGGKIYWWQKRIYVNDPACVRKIEVPYVEWDDSIKLYVNDTVVWQNWPYCGERGANFTSHPGLVAYGESLIKAFKHGDNYLKIQLCVGGYGECWTNWRIYLEPYYKIRLLTDNGCNSYENNLKCKLKEEEVCDKNGNNCVYTVKDFNSTGVSASLLKKCYSYTQGNTGQKWLVCADGDKFEYETNTISNTLPNNGILETGEDIWWTVKRVYTCKADAMTIPSLDREKNVEQNSEYNSGSGIAAYPDATTAVNGIGGYNGTYQAQWKYDGDADQCQYSCIVQVPTVRSNAVAAGSETTNTVHDTSKDISVNKTYLACKKDVNDEWYCPATGDQQVIQPCVCLDQGAQSIAVMSALISAAKDLTCSTK